MAHLDQLAFLEAVAPTDREALLDPVISGWIVQGDAASLTASGHNAQGLLTDERCLLNQAWAALISGDLFELPRILPVRVQDLGDQDWSFAAEAALLWAFHYYFRGDLQSAGTFAGLAQVGLSGVRRQSLLRPTLLLQARIALHQNDRDAAEATWQQAAALTWEGVGARCWSSAIESIASLAAGRYDSAVEAAARALECAREDNVAPHLFPTCLWVVLAGVERDRGNSGEAVLHIGKALEQLRQYPNLPVQIEIAALSAHVSIDQGSSQIQEAIAGLMALGTHPLASPELQDLIDIREGHLRVRVNELTRARVLIDRLGNSAAKTFLEASADAEARPSKTLVQTSGGTFRWHRQQIEVEMLRARARRREPLSSVLHVWRALEMSSESGIVRPLLDNPMAARHFSRPDLEALIAQVSDRVEPRTHAHLQRVLAMNQRSALFGPESHSLTARELEVLRAVANGGDFSSVAKLMVLSRWTVRGHFYSACKKLGISGREAAIIRLQQIDHTAMSLSRHQEIGDSA